jgi:peptidoglycan hydrolase CwlO-like protein
MICKTPLASLAVAVWLSLSLTACKDTKTLQENDQLKAKIAELQKQNGELGNNIDTLTAARDSLMKENEALRSRIKPTAAKRARRKPTARKRHRA